MGLRISLRLKALASSLLRSPPGVCLWSPHQTTRPLRGTRAMAEDSSRFPYCWPSSLRAMSTSPIHLASGLYGCEHSWWKPPPQPMITCFPRRTSLRKAGGTSNLVLLAGPFSSSVTPTNRVFFTFPRDLVSSKSPHVVNIFYLHRGIWYCQRHLGRAWYQCFPHRIYIYIK